MDEREKLGLPWAWRGKSDAMHSVGIALPYGDWRLRWDSIEGAQEAPEGVIDFIVHACNSHHQALNTLVAVRRWLRDNDEMCKSESACEQCHIRDLCIERQIELTIKAMEGKP